MVSLRKPVLFLVAILLASLDSRSSGLGKLIFGAFFLGHLGGDVRWGAYGLQGTEHCAGKVIFDFGSF